MAELKTKPNEASVDAFLDAVGNPVRRADARAAREMMERVTGYPAKMWGPSIIGFGSYRYRYESGREGEMCRLGFSPRAGQLVFYIAAGEASEDLLARLGKHKRGKGCLYVTRLADVDLAALEELVAAGLAYMDRTYPT